MKGCEDKTLDNLMQGNPYIVNNNKVNGILCIKKDDFDIYYIKLKNGLLSNNIIRYNKDNYIIYPVKNSKVQGIAKGYYESGKLQSEIPYKDGKANGTAKTYNEKGALIDTTPYSNGKRQGVKTVYDELGKMWAKITYQNGKAVSGVCNNGRKWTEAELSNFQNGLEVYCD